MHICKNKDDCQKCDKSWCFVNKSDLNINNTKEIKLKDGHIWYRVNSLDDIFHVLDIEGYDSYMLVNGNTGKGIHVYFYFK